jgi:hypothetical protein
MWHFVGVGLFVLGATGVFVVGALVLDIGIANERRGLPRLEGTGGWAVMGLAFLAVLVVGFVLAAMTG